MASYTPGSSTSVLLKLINDHESSVGEVVPEDLGILFAPVDPVPPTTTLLNELFSTSPISIDHGPGELPTESASRVRLTALDI